MSFEAVGCYDFYDIRYWTVFTGPGWLRRDVQFFSLGLPSPNEFDFGKSLDESVTSPALEQCTYYSAHAAHCCRRERRDIKNAQSVLIIVLTSAPYCSANRNPNAFVATVVAHNSYGRSAVRADYDDDDDGNEWTGNNAARHMKTSPTDLAAPIVRRFRTKCRETRDVCKRVRQRLVSTTSLSDLIRRFAKNYLPFERYDRGSNASNRGGGSVQRNEKRDCSAGRSCAQ